MEEVLAGMPEESSMVLRRVYFEGLTLAEVAVVEGLSSRQTSRLHRHALGLFCSRFSRGSSGQDGDI